MARQAPAAVDPGSKQAVGRRAVVSIAVWLLVGLVASIALPWAGAR